MIYFPTDAVNDGSVGQMMYHVTLSKILASVVTFEQSVRCYRTYEHTSTCIRKVIKESCKGTCTRAHARKEPNYHILLELVGHVFAAD